MIGRYCTGVNVDIDNLLYLLCFHRPMWFVEPFKQICGQAFLKKIPSKKYMYSVYKCLVFTKCTV